MATESPVRLIGSTSGARNWPLSRDTATFASSSSSNLAAQELSSILGRQRLEVEGNTQYVGPSRSGSAPPSMEGSALSILMNQQLLGSSSSLENLSDAIRSCESEEQLLSHPAYLDYYCANINLNPRLPPPRISRENRRLVHHMGGSTNNWKVHSFDDNSKGSLFSNRPVLPPHKEEPEDEKQPELDSVLAPGQFTSPMKGRHKSLVDLIQEDFPRTPSPVYTSQSRTASHCVAEEVPASDTCTNPLQASPMKLSNLSDLNSTGSSNRSRTPIPGSHVPKNDLSEAPVSCSSTSERTMSPLQVAKGEAGSGHTGGDSMTSDITNIDSETKSLKISKDSNKAQAWHHTQQNTMPTRGTPPHIQTVQAQSGSQGIRRVHGGTDQITNGQPKLASLEIQPAVQPTALAQPLFTSAAAYGTTYYANVPTSGIYSPNFNVGGYALNGSPVPPVIYPPQIAVPMPLDSPASPNYGPRTSAVPAMGNIAPGIDYQNLFKLYGHLGVPMQPSYTDPFYIPYFQNPSVDAYASGLGQYDPMRGNISGYLSENHDPQKGSLSSGYSTGQRPQFSGTTGSSTQSARKGGNNSPNYYGSPPNTGVFMRYPTSPLGSPVLQGAPVSGTSPVMRNENVRLPFSSGRTPGPYSGWQGQRGRDKVDDSKYTFLEELKSSKARRFELSDIAGRIVEFSADQHGSRFIQQKLESCTPEEKACVFEEVLPHASTLMTDVFGNYVIQKFFEHGNAEQRKELADQLVGHILTLSLQMYGCRVIQKALEVIDLDQKTKLVLELDGHVLRCVRDQNGNHVIQKCIECVPTERIGFIISSFRGQVATLSTHPYGCRVIQRVLEYCTDELQSQVIVDEILQSACILAQDQYGNYVTQHVLERGKPHERSQIIDKLAGQIVLMSQHKFASNVIEKCLENGSSEERELLIGEILAQTEGNDNLLTMMKDQFANYVVQKILETCSDKQREILLNRVRIHLQALKKYTYGKHIVTRVEQLCGEGDLVDLHQSEP